MKYELMACILVKAALVFGFSNIGHVSSLQANFVQSNFSWFFLHKHDVMMKSNNFVVGRYLFWIVWVLDLQWYFYLEKTEKNYMIFEERFLIHPPLDFNFVCWVGSKFGYSFCSSNLKSIKVVRKLWHSFSCKGPIFGHFALC